MKRERIIKIGRISYLKLFNCDGELSSDDYEIFQDEKYLYHCDKLFWRFYWVFSKEKVID